MKKAFSKIIALIVALASLVSVFSVLSFAEDSESTVVDDGFNPNQNLIINRDFADGWEATNGFTPSLGKHSASIDYEVADDLSYNYFMRLDYNNSKGQAKRCPHKPRQVLRRAVAFQREGVKIRTIPG